MMSLNRSSWCFGWRQKTWIYLKSLQKSDENVETNHTSTFHRSRACSLFGPASKMLIFWDALPPPKLVVIISGKAKCVFACGYGSWMQALFFICQDNTMRYNTHFFQKLLESKLSPGFGIWCMSPVFWIRFYRLLTRFSPCFLKFPTSFNQASSQIQPGFIVFACSAFSANFSPRFEVWHKLIFTKFSRKTYEKRSLRRVAGKLLQRGSTGIESGQVKTHTKITLHSLHFSPGFTSNGTNNETICFRQFGMSTPCAF